MNCIDLFKIHFITIKKHNNKNNKSKYKNYTFKKQ